MPINTLVHTHTHTHMHTYTHTHVHTYTHTLCTHIHTHILYRLSPHIYLKRTDGERLKLKDLLLRKAEVS